MRRSPDLGASPFHVTTHPSSAARAAVEGSAEVPADAGACAGGLVGGPTRISSGPPVERRLGGALAGRPSRVSSQGRAAGGHSPPGCRLRPMRARSAQARAHLGFLSLSVCGPVGGRCGRLCVLLTGHPSPPGQIWPHEALDAACRCVRFMSTSLESQLVTGLLISVRFYFQNQTKSASLVVQI